MDHAYLSRLFLPIGVAILAMAQQAPAQEQAPPVTGLVPDHATLSVANLDREIEWYVRVLGFKVLRKFDTDPANLGAQLYIPGYRFDLIEYKTSKRPAPVDPLYLQQGWIHVVFHVDNVARALTQLQALHVEPHEANKDAQGNLMQIRLRDPENNEVEIVPINPDQPTK